MMPTRQGSIHLFRLLGIDVFLHWSWFFVAYYSISTRIPNYHFWAWGVLEYLALFLIVLTHEFGHSLACRSVGGKADQVVLWPLGGVAYVDPPPRAGATLWSIAAGPLVNVVLFPILYGIVFLGGRAGWAESNPDMYAFFGAVAFMNLCLLGFNVLPIYPLDGGQILRSLLWFGLGQARSLIVATVLGFIGGAGLLLLVLLGVRGRGDQLYLAALVAFLLLNCWRGFQYARRLRKAEQLPRRREYACPVCHASPPIGHYWQCQRCSEPFDMFAAQAVCPHCHLVHDVVPCPDCGHAKPLLAWAATLHDA